MLAKRIIPCLDIDRGRVVKGVKFESIQDAGDPVEVARRYDQQGADELVFLDITASSGRITYTSSGPIQKKNGENCCHPSWFIA